MNILKSIINEIKLRRRIKIEIVIGKMANCKNTMGQSGTKLQQINPMVQQVCKQLLKDNCDLCKYIINALNMHHNSWTTPEVWLYCFFIIWVNKVIQIFSKTCYLVSSWTPSCQLTHLSKYSKLHHPACPSASDWLQTCSPFQWCTTAICQARVMVTSAFERLED